MLEKATENLAEPVRTAVEDEPSEHFVAPALGERLEAGLAADQQWREERKEALLRGLCRASHRVSTGISTLAVVGLMEVLYFIGLGAMNGNPYGYTGWGVAFWYALPPVGACLAVLGLVPTLTGVVARKRLWKQVEREAVEIALPDTPTFPVPLPWHTGWRDRERASAELQYSIDYNEALGHTFRGACLFCAGASGIAALLLPVGIAALAAVVIILRLWEDLWFLHLIPVWAIVCGLPLVPAAFAALPALGSVVTSFWGRWLLRKAAEEGLEVQAPARCPWE